MNVVVGDNVVPMPDLRAGDRLVAVQATGDLLVVPAADHDAAADAVRRASAAFRELATAPDDRITAFFRGFADRLAEDAVWSRIAAASEADVGRARAGGRSTTRLAVSAKMRDAMIEGLVGWAKAPSRRGEVVERRDGPDWSVERRRAPLGVVAFVFEGRPNVFADGAGVVRGGNASVMRIGSDALDTAIAIEEAAIRPALEGAGLPEGSVTLVRSRSHAAAHALFTLPDVRLAVARGSGPATKLLGAIAAQHGIPVSLHGTGGAWLYVADDADPGRVRNAIVHSLDRKVCNTLNVCVAAPGQAGLVLAVLGEIGAVVHGEATDLSTEWEWEDVPEVSLVVATDDDHAIDLINSHSPRFVAGILTGSDERFERFYERVDAPYVGDGFTRWVDGQWAWDRPELGLTNWEAGRLLGRSGILSGDDVYTVRDVFRDRTGRAPQAR